MSTIGENARLLSNDVQAKWLIEDFPFRIQLASVLPFLPVAGDALRYTTTSVLQPGVTIGFEEGIMEDTKMPNDQKRNFTFAEIATHFRVSYKAQDVFSSNVNDQVSVQMALAIRELLYKFWMLFESGDSANPGEFDGLQKLVDPSRILDLGFRPLTLEVLEQGKELVRTNDGRGTVVFTNSIGKRAIHAAHWTRGLTPQYTDMIFPCPRNENHTERVLTVDGAPVYVNDLNQNLDGSPDAPDGEPVPENPLAPDSAGIGTNIWFFSMGENNLHGMTPAALDTGLFVTRSTMLPDGSTLVYHVTMPASIALGSASSLAVIKNALIPAHRSPLIDFDIRRA
ncbi:hypothetical protein SAMN05216302_1007125 [Nitrosomonas aestuarii]|uniref:Phage major capsid protein E n=1 Tax=Nitrosomonas aestuarii TaxID=52441 RepID=A0A1I3ZZZ6_9PROT|nr:hypothetical protein [Nitrosomonas aestuarii]SFK49099.1 hypothetical protein SAMN05216302_1007125 [Nitrosomonas aestuarii]